MNHLQAIGILIHVGGRKRWFAGFGKIGQLRTAWSLAGARLWQPGDVGYRDIAPTLARLRKKRADFRVALIQMVGQ